MYTFSQFLFFVILLFSLIYEIHCIVLVYVNTTRGSLVGYHQDNGNSSEFYYGQADIFLGVPFAQPPVGLLRYRLPSPLVQFPGPSPYNATYNRFMCVQPDSNLTLMSEDCLYMGLVSPNVSSTTKYPVMIFIHGGGLKTGYSHFSTTETTRNFASRGILFGSIEYRMGWLGFFTTLTDDFPPNLGMLDQVMALKFIKEEISFFGGDPNRVTIFGESAGGFSVSALTYSPLAQGLFQQAITESGNILTCYEDSVGFTYLNKQFAGRACNYTTRMWENGNFTELKSCLMNISVADGLAATERIGSYSAECWNMVQDNYFLPGNPQSLYKNRPNIPIIIGNCRDEKGFTEMGAVKADPSCSEYTREKMEDRMLKQFSYYGNQTENITKNIFEKYYLKPGTADDDHIGWLEFIVAAETPQFFTMPSLRDIQNYIMNGNPNVYTYEFDWASKVNDLNNPIPTQWNPVTHTCEIPYVFYYGNWSATDRAIADMIQGFWTNFAKYGKPSMDNTWTPTTSKNWTALEYFSFAENSSMKVGFRATDQIVWNEIIPSLVGEDPPNLVENATLCSKGYASKVKNLTCYEAFGTQLDWQSAHTACAQNSYGSLASVGSAFENSDLLNYAKNSFPTCSAFYIGLFRSQFLSNNSNFTWVNYDTSSYRNWKSGNPSSDMNARCVVVSASDGTWSNQACDQPQCYICGH